MSIEMNNNINDMLEALENDNNFIKLKQQYESPNAFTIMENWSREEVHSSFVSWLINPKQNHKLEKFPLEKFIKLLESKKEELEITKTDIADMEFTTEHNTDTNRKIDIFGISKSLVLVIENKVKAKETINKKNIPQSVDYYNYCEKNYKDRQRCYVLLKVFQKTHVVNENYIHITYQELFDEVIKPSYERCKMLKLEDTRNLLERYAIAISNPFASFAFANTQKDIAHEIYEKHAEIIEKMRVAMKNNDSDKESDICKVFKKNKKYINNIILKSLKKKMIMTSTAELKQLKGDTLVDVLIDEGYILADHTELIYKFKSATCIIMVDKNRKFYMGYCMGDYDGFQIVDAVDGVFEKVREAQTVFEKAVGSRSTNPGVSIYKLRLLRSGIEYAEGKLIEDILDEL